MLKKIKDTIIAYCESHCFDKTESGCYKYDLYADYRDGFDYDRVAEILGASDPMQRFYEVLDDAWFHYKP